MTIHGNTKKKCPEVGSRVRAIRLRLGLSLQVAATRGGTTPQTLIQLEKYGLATTRTLNCVSKALGVSVDELTGRREVAI